MLYAQQSFAHSQDIYEWDTLPRGVRVQGRITLDDLQNALSDNGSGLPTIGIPVEFSRDQIQSGNMISKQCEDCLILKNAEHPNDYFHFVFTTRTTGNVSTISIYRAGCSPMSGQKNKQEERKGSNSLFQNILGAVTKTDDRSLAEEYDYYAMVEDVIKNVLGI